MIPGSQRAGIDPIDAVHVMENHDHALQLWRQAGFRDRVLLHIDAHHDAWRLDDDRCITIGNFIGGALRHGVVREFRWVVPDSAFTTSDARAALVRQMKALARGHNKTGPREVRTEKTTITTSLSGTRLTACALGSLTAIDEPVLLDIDVDYFVIPKVAHNRADTHLPWPWCWPAELLAGLSARGIRSDFATIAYSVDGCYTTLPWKYLGDELAERLTHPRDSESVAGFELLRSGADHERLGQLDDARRCYERASALLAASAAPSLHLALLCARQSHVEEARSLHAAALRIDPTYDTGFSTLGPQYFWQKQYDAARSEFERALMLNPADAHACVGMARVAARQKRVGEAVAWYQRALNTCDELVDAHRGLADLQLRVGKLDQAAEHYERSLQLALHGQKPLSWHILTRRTPTELVDEDHCFVYGDLAGVYARQGQLARAIACYQIAFATSSVGVRLRLQLARLFARTRRWADARDQVALAIARAPRSLRYHARRAWPAA
jgi:tetratricopeptide (TPR) repeat protein